MHQATNQAVQWSPRRINKKKYIPRHIIVNMLKNKWKIVKATSGKNQNRITFKRSTITFIADSSTETIKSRKRWNGTLEGQEENNYQPRILSTMKICEKNEDDSGCDGINETRSTFQCKQIENSKKVFRY